MDICKSCLQAATAYSIKTLIDAYPLFDQVVLSGSEDESGKYYCKECYEKKFYELFFPLTEKGQWFSIVKAFRHDQLIMSFILKAQYVSCPLCGVDWDETEMIDFDKKTKEFFEYIFKKNDLKDIRIPKMLCMSCAGKIEVSRLKKIKPEKYPLFIHSIYTNAGKLFLEQKLKGL